MKTVQLIILLGLVYCAFADDIFGFSGKEHVKASGYFNGRFTGGFSGVEFLNGDYKYPLLCPDEQKCEDFCLKYDFDGGYCEGPDLRKCHCYVIVIQPDLV